MKKLKLVIFLFVCLVVIVVVENQTKILHHLYNNILYDNQNHYLPCSKLPTEAFVNEVLSSHQDTVEAILEVNPGNVGIDIDTITCPGKADLIIWYASHQNRLAIQKIVANNDFYGVPVSFQNR